MPKDSNPARVLREALQWFERLDKTEVSVETLYKFFKWREDFENRRVYDEISAAHYDGDRVTRHARPTFH